MDNKFCKFYKWQKYVSYDNGLTWSPLNEYTKGELYESLSVDCGGGRTVYRWVLIDEYACEEVQDKYTYNFSNGDGTRKYSVDPKIVEFSDDVILNFD